MASNHYKCSFNSKELAEQLEKAMKGFGCNKKLVVQTLCSVSNNQRQEIAKDYKLLYGQSLNDELKSNLSGDLENLILALIVPSNEYDARQLYNAMSGIGTNESVLIEILSTRTPKQIQAIKVEYRKLYNTELEEDIVNNTSGDFKNILVSLSTGNRDEKNSVDRLKANKDAHLLYEAGEQIGTDESVFNSILASQNYNQLKEVFNEYTKVSKGSRIEDAINKEFSGNIHDCLIAIIKTVRNREAYFAELLYNSMKGFGTNDEDLIRIVVSRSEIDLAHISEVYEQQYNTSLEKAIKSDCSGSYKDGLIALVRGN